MSKTQVQPSPETLARMMATIQTMQQQIDALTGPKPVSKVERDITTHSRDWINEWVNTPVVKTEFVYLGCAAYTAVLMNDGKRFVPELNRQEPTPDCIVEFKPYLGPVPESIMWDNKEMKRLRRISWADLLQDPNIEIDESDIAEFNLPEGTRPRSGEHKLKHMYNRMLLEHKKQPDILMPLERFKILARIEFEAQWQKEDQILANKSLLTAYDERQIITGQLDTGEFASRLAEKARQKERELAAVSV